MTDQIPIEMLRQYMIEEILRMREFRKQLHKQYPELLGEYTDDRQN